ncbi:uncharacterized protein LOC125195000 [Salvia hispanica]|uniref:uncharacterized protein LOC125195000 n=1 Tax=Salvia hispanica TaxID=49212 RepID=UPI00200940B7|nr:uncharacterized protein LOC125195000 [Salvia hispanica]
MVAKTEISEVTYSKFLYSRFAFKNFDEIARLDRAAEETFFGIIFVDVIGVIVAPGRVLCQPKCRLIEIEIANENHNRIFCTIWDANVDSYLQQLEKSKGTLPIIIVQFCRPNMFKGEMRVSTHFNSSQVFINADISEVKQFRSR